MHEHYDETLDRRWACVVSPCLTPEVAPLPTIASVQATLERAEETLREARRLRLPQNFDALCLHAVPPFSCQDCVQTAVDAERHRVFAMLRQDIQAVTGLDWSPLEGRTLEWVFAQYKATGEQSRRVNCACGQDTADVMYAPCYACRQKSVEQYAAGHAAGVGQERARLDAATWEHRCTDGIGGCLAISESALRAPAPPPTP